MPNVRSRFDNEVIRQLLISVREIDKCSVFATVRLRAPQIVQKSAYRNDECVESYKIQLWPLVLIHECENFNCKCYTRVNREHYGIMHPFVRDFHFEVNFSLKFDCSCHNKYQEIIDHRIAEEDSF